MVPLTWWSYTLVLVSLAVDSSWNLYLTHQPPNCCFPVVFLNFLPLCISSSLGLSLVFSFLLVKNSESFLLSQRTAAFYLGSLNPVHTKVKEKSKVIVKLVLYSSFLSRGMALPALFKLFVSAFRQFFVFCHDFVTFNSRGLIWYALLYNDSNTN
jgi:hypothetical protein